MSTACDEGYVSLSPGTVITLGGVHKFRFNHPAEAAVLRERRRVGAAQPKMKSSRDNTDDEQVTGMLWLIYCNASYPQNNF